MANHILVYVIGPWNERTQQLWRTQAMHYDRALHVQQQVEYVCGRACWIEFEGTRDETWTTIGRRN